MLEHEIKLHKMYRDGEQPHFVVTNLDGIIIGSIFARSTVKVDIQFKGQVHNVAACFLYPSNLIAAFCKVYK